MAVEKRQRAPLVVWSSVSTVSLELPFSFALLFVLRRALACRFLAVDLSARCRCPHLISPSLCPHRVLLLWLGCRFLWPCCLKRHLSVTQCDLIGSSGCQLSSRACSKWLWYCTAYISGLSSPPFSLLFLHSGSLQRFGLVGAEYGCVKPHALLRGRRAGRACLASGGRHISIRGESFANSCCGR